MKDATPARPAPPVAPPAPVVTRPRRPRRLRRHTASRFVDARRDGAHAIAVRHAAPSAPSAAVAPPAATPTAPIATARPAPPAPPVAPPTAPSATPSPSVAAAPRTPSTTAVPAARVGPSSPVASAPAARGETAAQPERAPAAGAVPPRAERQAPVPAESRATQQSPGRIASVPPEARATERGATESGQRGRASEGDAAGDRLLRRAVTGGWSSSTAMGTRRETRSTRDRARAHQHTRRHLQASWRALRDRRPPRLTIGGRAGGRPPAPRARPPLLYAGLRGPARRAISMTVITTGSCPCRSRPAAKRGLLVALRDVREADGDVQLLRDRVERLQALFIRKTLKPKDRSCAG